MSQDRTQNAIPDGGGGQQQQVSGAQRGSVKDRPTKLVLDVWQDLEYRGKVHGYHQQEEQCNDLQLGKYSLQVREGKYLVKPRAGLNGVEDLKIGNVDQGHIMMVSKVIP